MRGDRERENGVNERGNKSFSLSLSLGLFIMETATLLITGLQMHCSLTCQIVIAAERSSSSSGRVNFMAFIKFFEGWIACAEKRHFKIKRHEFVYI